MNIHPKTIRSSALSLAMTGLAAFMVWLMGGQIAEVFSSFRQLLGPCWWLFVALMVMLLSTLGSLSAGGYPVAKAKTTRLEKTEEGQWLLVAQADEDEHNPLDDLMIVEDLSVPFGFMGTVIGMARVLFSLNFDLANLMPTILAFMQGIGESFSTTIAGLILFTLAYLSRKKLAPLLIKRQAEKHVNRDGGNYA